MKGKKTATIQCFSAGLQEIQVRDDSPARAMSQQASSSPPPSPSVVKIRRKGIGALLVVLVSLGAFAGVTVAYIVLPYFQGSNNNGVSCRTNCSNGGSPCGTGCLQAAITGNDNPSSPYVHLVNLNATSSTTVKMTLQAVGASQLNLYSITVTDTSTGASTFESCQQCGISNSPSVVWIMATGSSSQLDLRFKTGDSYTVQLSDSGNSSTYYFHF